MNDGPALVNVGGMTLAEGVSLEEWARIGGRIGQAVTGFQFAIGDWLVYGQDHFGDGAGSRAFAGDLLDYACELTKLDRQTLKNYAWVARRVSARRRYAGLSFSHYLVLAKLPEAEQEEWLTLANGEEKRVPTRQFAKSIELSAKNGGERRIFAKEEIVEDALSRRPAFIDAPETSLDRFIRSMERQDFSEWTEAMKGHLRLRWEKALALMEALDS